jgi:hypothetical protein
VGLNLYTMVDDVERRRMLTRHVSHMGKGRRALIRRIAYLPNSMKQDNKQNILHGIVLAPAG